MYLIFHSPLFNASMLLNTYHNSLSMSLPIQFFKQASSFTLM